MILASCPQCARRIEIHSNPEIGQQVECQDCQTVLVVTWLYPVCLDFLDESAFNHPKPDPQQGSDRPAP